MAVSCDDLGVIEGRERERPVVTGEVPLVILVSACSPRGVWIIITHQRSMWWQPWCDRVTLTP